MTTRGSEGFSDASLRAYPGSSSKRAMSNWAFFPAASYVKVAGRLRHDLQGRAKALQLVGATYWQQSCNPGSVLAGGVQPAKDIQDHCRCGHHEDEICGAKLMQNHPCVCMSVCLTSLAVYPSAMSHLTIHDLSICLPPSCVRHPAIPRLKSSHPEHPNLPDPPKHVNSQP